MTDKTSEDAKSLVALLRLKHPHDDRRFKLTDTEAEWLVQQELHSALETGRSMTVKS